MSAKVGSNSYEGAQKGAQSPAQVHAEILRRRAKARAIREQNERSKGKR